MLSNDENRHFRIAAHLVGFPRRAKPEDTIMRLGRISTALDEDDLLGLPCVVS